MSTPRNLLISAVLASATGAEAASTVNLAVNGLIVPSACTPTLSHGGEVDYGKVAARDLNLNSITPLPYVTLQLAVNCEAATLFALKGIDNRPGTTYEARSFGLGIINGTEKVGGYYTILNNATADGRALTPIGSSDGGATWQAPTDGNLWWLASELAAFGNDASGAVAPVPIQTLSSDLLVRGYIGAAATLTLTEEQPIDGAMTAEVFYL